MRITSARNCAGVELVHARVVVAVARQFVAVGDDAPHQRRVPLGDPAEHEERALARLRREQVEHAAGVELDARLGGVPGVARDRPLERRDLEILLDVDRQRIARHGRHRARSPIHQPS